MKFGKSVLHKRQSTSKIALQGNTYLHTNPHQNFWKDRFQVQQFKRFKVGATG